MDPKTVADICAKGVLEIVPERVTFCDCIRIYEMQLLLHISSTLVEKWDEAGKLSVYCLLRNVRWKTDTCEIHLPWFSVILRQDRGHETYELAWMQPIGISDRLKRYGVFFVFFHTKVSNIISAIAIISACVLRLRVHYFST